MAGTRAGAWIKGFITAIVLAVVLGGVTIYAGLYNVAATARDPGFVRKILSTTSDRSVMAHAPKIPVPQLGDSAQLLAGANDYNETCLVCHGAPGHDRGDAGQGLNPKPPHLTHVFDDWNNSQVFWIVKNGIKMTGMPAFGGTHRDADIWAIIAFMHRFPNMTKAQYEAWVRAAARDTTGGGV